MIPSRNTRFGIDHPLVTVHDHPRRLSHYARMGFAPSPVSYHPWGTVTSLMMFAENFIELIGVDDATRFGTHAVGDFCFGRYLGSFLAREEGVSLVALHSKDARADHARLVQAGLTSQGILDFRRAMRKPDGTPDEAVVSLGLFIDASLGDASNFICHQHRPELIWVPEWQAHPNGATAVVGVTYVTPDAAALRELAARWQRMYGARHVDVYDGGALADTGCGQLLALSQPRAEARYAAVGLPMAQGVRTHAVAITVLAPDLAHVERLWRENGVPYGYNEHGLVVEPEFAGNVVLEFVNHPH
ncbi:VOC family protein [Pandoraea nosoerga]|uniref:VOC family protein n=1 Tax=Pandoraea nosoerga TaxID=2508296 RepID=A0A5E4U319_9BURK|nr:VOC family protein [Pandoraea nosoerga]MBN4667811.1 VOC family protein [Pandoraea nosoerga]MBN4677709.1 VOC family protein [Pandoraea nosoerga]MBN4682680.1 VOC family protein [Pandoraea nosoerga]MBN4746879.1 VOC family protein [Pandoraea nosoerga]VVD94465.1 VOC family protein [Pandoraea nosoerga]